MTSNLGKLMFMFAAVSLGASFLEWTGTLLAPQALLYSLFGVVAICWSIAIVGGIFRAARWPGLSFNDVQHLWIANSPGWLRLVSFLGVAIPIGLLFAFEPDGVAVDDWRSATARERGLLYVAALSISLIPLPLIEGYKRSAA